MRFLPPLLVVLAILLPAFPGCISAETRAELAAANKAVAALEVKVAEAAAKNAPDLESIKAQLAEAKADLEATAIKAEEEIKAQVNSGASGAETAISTVSPILAIIFPAVTPILSALALLAGRVKSWTKPRATA